MRSFKNFSNRAKSLLSREYKVSKLVREESRSVGVNFQISTKLIRKFWRLKKSPRVSKAPSNFRPSRIDRNQLNQRIYFHLTAVPSLRLHLYFFPAASSKRLFSSNSFALYFWKKLLFKRFQAYSYKNSITRVYKKRDLSYNVGPNFIVVDYYNARTHGSLSIYSCCGKFTGLLFYMNYISRSLGARSIREFCYHKLRVFTQWANYIMTRCLFLVLGRAKCNSGDLESKFLQILWKNFFHSFYLISCENWDHQFEVFIFYPTNGLLFHRAILFAVLAW